MNTYGRGFYVRFVLPQIRYLFLVLFLVVFSAAHTQAYGQNLPANASESREHFHQPVRALTEDDAFTKLGRGISNMIEGPFELYTQTAMALPNEDVIYAFSVGLTKGLAMVVARELVGAYEIVTFPLPLPAGYQPVLDPATTFTNFDWRSPDANGH